MVFHFATQKVQSLSLTPPTTTNCRVKRHWMTRRSQQNGQPAEIKPDITIFKQRVKMRAFF